jgi:anti-sigma regulatory factor (Ser/Thr protein kinase)/GNAT superfamily N-acetyltransferase
MEAHLYLEARLGMIGPATDFTYKWCVNIGLDSEDATRMALSVDEILTNVILHAYGKKGGYHEMWFQYSISEIEITIQDFGEPFDPDRHPFSVEKALSEGDFEGAGHSIVRKMTDHFLFLNRGRDGKEFRLVKNLTSSHIKELLQPGHPEEEEEDLLKEEEYRLTTVTGDDAEDISKLIYQSYDFTYTKDDLYYPKRIELAIRNEYKFGVIARSSKSRPAGYFAVIRNSDSMIGEIGEAVVSPHDRKKGLMKKMLHQLIDLSKQRGLLGLYGLALTVHTISQKVNADFGFNSCAMIIAKSPMSVYKGLREDYPQPISVILDYLPLTGIWNVPVYLPSRYEVILRKIYHQFERHPELKRIPEKKMREDAETKLHLNIFYNSNSALITVQRLGRTFESSIQAMLKSIEDLSLNSIYIDLPLIYPRVDLAVEWLSENGFIFAGLMPFFHREIDHLRMQWIDVPIEFKHIETLTEVSGELKEIIRNEYHALHPEKIKT